jgi:hypothetical protein
MGIRQKLAPQEWMSHRPAYRLLVVSNYWLLGSKRLFHIIEYYAHAWEAQ